MKKEWTRRLAALVSCAACLTALLPVSAAQNEPTAQNETAGREMDPADNSYADYLELHETAGYAQTAVAVPVDAYAKAEKTETAAHFHGSEEPVLITEEGGMLSYDVTIEQEGLYALAAEYYPIDNGGTIRRKMTIDGAVPFDEAESAVLPRVFRDETPLSHRDGKNDTVPTQVPADRFVKTYISGTGFGNSGKLLFYLTAGTHRIGITALEQKIALRALSLESFAESAADYTAYLAACEKAGAKKVSGALTDGLLLWQAEECLEKSDASLYAVNDNSSPYNQPFDLSKQKLNVIGKEKWQDPGQWISWEITVPESGLYRLGFRAKQSYSRDVDSVRAVYIDGELPFREAGELTFGYNDRWQVTLAGGETPYWFCLEKGTHTVTMQVADGALSALLRRAEKSVQALNQANWALLTLMGSEPDPYRDYNIDLYMPETVELLAEQAQVLQALSDEWMKITGERGANVVQIDVLVYELREMAESPEKIPEYFAVFRDNLSNFANMVMNAYRQPLGLDYLFLCEEGAALPKAEPSFFGSLYYGVRRFFASFFSDYNVLSEETESGEQKEIRLWIGNGLTGGRDQAITLNNLILRYFTAEKNIGVRVEIVPPSTILTATVAGEGPDVALQLNSGDPVNYAMRHAVKDLSALPGFDQIAGQFPQSTFAGFTYQNGIYALPETLSFPVMFYRRDILRRLGIDADAIETWDDLLELLPVIQGENMNVSVAAGYMSYVMLLYQSGGKLYRNGDTESDLDSAVSLDAFDRMMELYTQFGLPVSYSFAQRFRTGEIVIGVEDCTQYNMLQISAPEIRNNWGIAAVPGTRLADGSISRTVPVSATGCVIMSACRDIASAWEFLQWYTDAETQYQYGRELESVMGLGARYFAANEGALTRLNWSVAEKTVLTRQIGQTAGIPEVPGGYLTARNVGFAITTAYSENADARRTLLGYVDSIHAEIALKRKEFSLSGKGEQE